MIRHTVCQFFKRDIVKLVHLLHDQLLLVDLDDERSVAFVSSEPELANRVLQLLRDVYGVGLVLGNNGSVCLSASSYCS
jgi:hypothetical protein